MKTRSQRATPGFFWHGLLIVLPVVFLAALGLLSLRQDQRLAEQDAKHRAGEIVEQLGARLSRVLGEELERIETLASDTTAAHAGPLRSPPANDSSDAGERFGRDAPAVYTNLASDNVLFGPAWIGASGKWIHPRAWTTTPTPPDWFIDLTEDQSHAWQRAQMLELRGAEAEEVAKAWQRFQETMPGVDGEACLELALLRLEAKTNTPAEAVERFVDLGRRYGHMETDSGVPLTAISFANALRHSTDIGITDSLLVGLRDQVNWPSLLTPYFLREVERLAGVAEIATVDALKAVWERQEEHRQLLRNLFEQNELEGLTATNLWFDGLSNRWLAVLSLEWIQLPAEVGAGQSFITNQVTAIRCFPKGLLRKAFADGLHGFTLPSYFGLSGEFEGEPMTDRRPTESLRPTDSQGSLASVSGAILRPLRGGMNRSGSVQVAETPPVLVRADPDLRFHLAIQLVDPAALYARQRQRAMWFGVFILAVAGAAVMGFVGARRAYLRERQLNELKSNFVSSVSHELRAPIASVRLLSESLDLGKVQSPEKQRAYFQFIVQECRRLSALIANLLDFSRIEQGRKQYEFEPTDVLALVRETVGLMQANAAERTVKLAWDDFSPVLGLSRPYGTQATTDSDSQPVVDGHAIQQALVNLIDNALKHSPPGSTVSVGLAFEVEREAESRKSAGARRHGNQRSESGGVRIWVEDQGPGIPASEHERIFERFYRIGSELRRETQGVGIGLSIVKHIVEAHRGWVRVESEVGKGSRFTINLPSPDTDSLTHTFHPSISSQNSHPPTL